MSSVNVSKLGIGGLNNPLSPPRPNQPIAGTGILGWTRTDERSLMVGQSALFAHVNADELFDRKRLRPRQSASTDILGSRRIEGPQVRAGQAADCVRIYEGKRSSLGRVKRN